MKFAVLNAVTRKDAYPLPRIDDTLDTLGNSKWLSTLHLISGYWQVELSNEAQEKTTFSMPENLFEFKVLFWSEQCTSNFPAVNEYCAFRASMVCLFGLYGR